MGKSDFSIIERAALWRANGTRCFYCTELIAFCDLEIDHIIPESTPPDRLENLVHKLDLGERFLINSFRNLVPTHHNCNRRKSNTEFSEGNLRFYLALWQKKQSGAEREFEALQRQKSNEQLLTALAAQIEAGRLSTQEVITFIQSLAQKDRPEVISEPWVISLGLNVPELLESESLPSGAPHDYATLCDWLEERLLIKIRQRIPSLSAQTEASARNGETLSIRFAFWNLDLNHLSGCDLSPWEILEIAPYSDIYDTKWDDLFPKAVVQTHHAIVADADEPVFGLRLCPKCASDRLKHSGQMDYKHDEIYYLIECEECGWGDWTQ